MPRAVPILMYHAIAAVACARESAYTTPAQVFEQQMRQLCERGWTGITVGELVNRWEQGRSIAPGTVAISLDDGFACAYDTAWPILARYGHRATVYAISGYLDRMGRFDADLGVPARPMLSRAQVRALHEAGIEIGSHSVNHCDLRRMPAAALHNELVRSRSILQDLIGAPIEHLAYPRGLFDRRVRRAVIDAGYRSACATLPGLDTATTDRFALRRAQVGDDPNPARFEAQLRWGGQPASIARTALRSGLISVIAPLVGADAMDFRMQPLRRALRRYPIA